MWSLNTFAPFQLVSADGGLGFESGMRPVPASELTSRGASTTEVMLAGNWKTSRMVAPLPRWRHR